MKSTKNEISEVAQVKNEKPLLNVENLNMSFKIRGLYFNALKNVSFSVNQGDFFGIIGESGSGKSTTGKCIIKLYQPTGGKIEIDNHLISNKKLSYKTNKWLRKNVQMIFQDPMASLNPTKNVLQLISEPLVINKTIYKNAFKNWKTLNNVGQYFMLEYLKAKDELVYEYQFNYLNELKTILNDFYNNFDDGLSNTETHKATREKLIFKMDTLVENCQSKSALINDFLKKHESLVQDLTEKYNNQDYDKVFKNYENGLVELTNLKNLYNNSTEGVEYKKLYDQHLHEKKTLMNNFKETYLKQNYGYIKSFETTTKSNIKSLKHNLHFSKDAIDYTIHYVNYIIQKFMLLFVKQMKKNKFLEEEAISIITNGVQEKVDILFKPINEKIMKLSVYFENASIENKNIIIENLYALRLFANSIYENYKQRNWDNYDWNKKIYDEIYNKYPRFNQLDDEIKCSIYTYEKFEDTMDNNRVLYQDLFEIEEKLVSESLLTKNNYKEQLRLANAKLSKTKLDFKICRAYYNEQKEEKIVNKQNFENCLIEFEKLSALRQDYLDNVVFAPLFSDERKNELEKQKATLKAIKSDIKLLNKQINKKIKETLSKTKSQSKNSNEAKEVKEKILNIFNVDSFTSSLKKEVNLRKKSVDALKFEFHNSMVESKINSFIFEKSRHINWVAIPMLNGLIKREMVYKALDSVGLKREHAYRYPHEFSGGQRQRIVIARALINNPKIIIADEPISALDVSIQAQIINILQDLCQKQNVTILFIAHDLSMVNYACNKVIIMHRGRILEKGNVDKIFENPIHPYTRSLMKATPKLSRVHVDLAGFNENFTYDKEWTTFNKPDFVHIEDDPNHQVFGTIKQVKTWIKSAEKENGIEE